MKIASAEARLAAVVDLGIETGVAAEREDVSRTERRGDLPETVARCPPRQEPSRDAEAAVSGRCPMAGCAVASVTKLAASPGRRQ
jgi:hypothetical protein